MLCLYVCVRGACAVRVAGDELLFFSAFVVHRVAHCAGQRREDEHETTAEDERDLWEESIPPAVVVCFVVVNVVIIFECGGRERRVVVRECARPGVLEGKKIDSNLQAQHRSRARAGGTQGTKSEEDFRLNRLYAQYRRLLASGVSRFCLLVSYSR